MPQRTPLTIAEYKNLSRQLSFTPALGPLISHLFVDTGLLGLFVLFASSSSLLMLVLSQLILPIIMFRAFALMHDSIHYVVCRNRVGNDLIGNICGAICLLPFQQWRQIHLEHHRWAGNIDKDPTMRLVKEFKNGWRPGALAQFFWRLWVPYLGLKQHLVFWSDAIGRVRGEPGRIAQLRAGTRLSAQMLLYPTACFMWPGTFNPLSLVPGIFLYLILVETVNFPHHLQVPTVGGQQILQLRQQYLTTRSCVYPRWISRHITNNFNYHIEHHLFPRLPWYRLDAVSVQLKQRLGRDYNETRRNRFIVENRQKPLGAVLQPTPLNEPATGMTELSPQKAA